MYKLKNKSQIISHLPIMDESRLYGKDDAQTGSLVNAVNYLNIDITKEFEL